MAEWNRKFGFDPPLTISVNVSARHLNDAGLVQEVESALAKTGLDPECLKLILRFHAFSHNFHFERARKVDNRSRQRYCFRDHARLCG
jgi:EAL domain-containing protein (putative c-di-GMP-specific phosphodiesterase class I)